MGGAGERECDRNGRHRLPRRRDIGQHAPADDNPARGAVRHLSARQRVSDRVHPVSPELGSEEPGVRLGFFANVRIHLGERMGKIRVARRVAAWRMSCFFTIPALLWAKANL